MKGLIVAKFGGTSMADAKAMKKSARIVLENANTKLVVVSATSGTTNQLLNIYQHACEQNQDSLLNDFELIEQRHNSIAQDLNLSVSKFKEVRSICQGLYQEMRLTVSDLQKFLKKNEDSETQEEFDAPISQLREQLLSIGERLSSVLFAAAFQLPEGDSENAEFAECFDVRQVMVTDDHYGKAEPDIAEIEKRAKRVLLPLIQSKRVIVVQGFIGSTREGKTTTLGRGGSDYSAALLAEGLDAEVCQIWTDVPGILTMDPNTVPTARVISRISFDEAAELANFGAKVLHPATVWPAIRKKIQVFVGSTFQPDRGGTWIFSELSDRPAIRAIALRKNQTLITVSSLRMLNAQGFLAKLFSILAQHRLSVDLVTTSEVSVALTIDGTNLGSAGKNVRDYKAMLKELSEFCEVKIEENLTLIAIIGNNLTHTPGLSAKAFSAISDYNVRLICHGASGYNLCFLVKQEDGVEVAKKLHHKFIDG